MFDTLRKLYDVFDPREKRRAIVVFFLLLTVAVAEVAGVGSIMPFMAVLAEPETIHTNAILSAIYDYFGFESTQSFSFFLGAAFFTILIGSLVLKAFGEWVQQRFSTMRIHVLGCHLVVGYLNQPYEWFLNRHSSGMGAAILSEVNQVVMQALFPAMQIIANSMISILLVALLVLMDPLLALSVAFVLGAAYSIIYFLARHYLERIGEDRQRANRGRFRAIEETFGAVKEVKLLGLETSCLEKFRGPSRLLAHRRVASRLIAELPAFAMQGITYGSMLLVLLYLMATQGGLQEALPLLTLYAFAAYRLMPALQNVYRNIATVKFSKAAVDTLHEDILALKTDFHINLSTRPAERPQRLPFQNVLELRDVSYKYPNAEQHALKRLSLSVKAKHKVGFVGSTGSGKTTTADVILGLLKPESGQILVDGTPIDDSNLRRWQSGLGYVPQQIFLSDDTVAANIAFGIPKHAVDLEAVERAAKIACLHDFVTQELPDAYDTEIGERGVRLSGGQRQRIGIARALYHDPDVLIFDEATSALDNLTEKVVMEAVNNIGRTKTVILIAHRLSTVRNCDEIFLMERGEISAKGSYDELIESSEAFQKLVAVGE